MDKIYIKNLEIFANHGVLDEEKKLGQKFIISLGLSLSLRQAAIHGNLNETVNYAKLCCEIENEFKKEKYDLIETAAEKIAEFILLNYEIVESIKVLLKKPWAPIGKPVEYAAVEIERKRHIVYIGIGSNMGDKEKNLRDAIELINSNICNKVTKESKFYVTKPVGYLEQDDFINCAIEIKTLFQPGELMDFLLDVEKQLKRERVIRWGPRTIDLDILLYDDLICSNEHTIIPHPRMAERLFVIKPLCDIAPYVVHPILNKRIRDIEVNLSEKEEL
ncbi:MAG: dihydroneopterin aldolase/2-amino-4-hydroxy-6-hydroxymethyldihydropteridine pyrophosphokinae [Clostridiaceae bacterium]|nr:dihydroneopterin aldolase/2-amino-4-hydroxy-6-hydroxymethyldihydropteridine pyrophosphokinae [Clostridiaceae bacterium]